MIRAHYFRTIITGLVSKRSSILVKSDVCFSHSVLHLSTLKENKSSNTQTVFEFLVHRHKISPEVASHVDSAFNSILKNPNKRDSTLSFLKECGFTIAQLERILKARPSILSTSVEKTIKPKFKILQDMGFSAKQVVDIILTEPSILHASAQNKVMPALSLLRDLLGSSEEVAKALRKSGWLLMTDLEKNMVPNIKYLNSCGVSMEQIHVLINYLPRLLLYKPEAMRRCVEKVDQLGMNRSSGMFMYAVGIVGSMADGIWERKLQAFRDILGFSKDDILRAFKHSPQVFAVSEDKMKKVKEVLLATGKYNISCIAVKYPKALMYSIEKRYKPRFEVLNILESRNLIKKWPSLGGLYRFSDAGFSKKFISPYLHDPVLYNWCKENSMVKGQKDHIKCSTKPD